MGFHVATFLDRQSATMNRTALRFATGHLEPDTRQHCLNRRERPSSKTYVTPKLLGAQK